VFLTSALDGGEWLALRPGTHWIGGCEGPKNRSECGGEEKKIHAPAGRRTPVPTKTQRAINSHFFLA